MPKLNNKQIKLTIISLVILLSSICLYITPRNHNPPKKIHKLTTKLNKLHNSNKRLLLNNNVVDLRKLHVQQMKYQIEVKNHEQQKAKTKNEKYIIKFQATITSYTSGEESTDKSPGDEGYGITTSGRHVQEGITLSCPPAIPLGTWVEIEDIGKRRCDDRGSAINFHHFDLYIEKLQDALAFGVQHKTVYIQGSESK